MPAILLANPGSALASTGCISWDKAWNGEERPADPHQPGDHPNIDDSRPGVGLPSHCLAGQDA
ncbi:hypothetical protein ACFYNO_09185 [Kitasatospora sp. NPDC006697]|uniref:hypothetical protein n=1 Tax=Kitasatospora sp. NPDC006697 TaxID=3364020 RepID=UPI003683F41F